MTNLNEVKTENTVVEKYVTKDGHTIHKPTAEPTVGQRVMLARLGVKTENLNRAQASEAIADALLADLDGKILRGKEKVAAWELKRIELRSKRGEFPQA